MSWGSFRQASSPTEPTTEPVVDFRSILRRNYKLLSRCLVVSDDLLFELKSVDYMREKVSEIRQVITSDQKVTGLLNILDEVPGSQRQSVFSTLLSALRQDGQEHVANIFLRQSDARPMSHDNYKLLVSKQQQVCQYLDPMNGLVDELVTLGVFDQKDKSRIFGLTRYDDKTSEVVSIILHKPDSAFHIFIQALNNAEQQHVVHILTGQGESPLSHLRRLVLRKARDKLLDRVDTLHTSLLAKLISGGVLTDADKQRIEAHTVNEDRSAELIDVIARKSQNAYDKFIQSLKDSGHRQIAEELEGLEVRGLIDPLFFSDCLPAERTRIVRVLRNSMKVLVSGKGDEINEITSLMEQNGFAVCEVSDGSIHISFRCFTTKSLANLKRLYSNQTLDKLLTKVFCPQFADQGLRSLSLRIMDNEFQKLTEAFGQTTLLERSQTTQLRALPLEMLELVLTRTFLRLFSDHYDSHYTTHGAIRLAYNALAGVCNDWWQTMNGWPQSATKHWFKHKLHGALTFVCRPYVVSPRQQFSQSVYDVVRGVTVCDNKLFVLCWNSILVFGPNKNQFTSNELEQFNNPSDIVSCTETQQLFVADTSLDSDYVWRVSLVGRQVAKWLPNKSTTTAHFRANTLSLTSRRLLVTSQYNNELLLCGADGFELRRVPLPDTKWLQHAVETSRGTFIVSHLEPQPRVCEVNVDGHVTRVYCDKQNMFNPIYLSLDSDGQIFVADFINDRVLLLNSETLELERVLLDRQQHQLTVPRRLCYTQDTGQLAVCSSVYDVSNGQLMAHCVQLFTVR